MNNLTKKFFSTLLIIASLTSVAIPITYAQQKPQPTNTQSNQKPKKSISILAAILSLLKEKEPPRTSRGKLCPISPGNLGEQLIWSDRPLFIWRGDIPQSTVNLYSSSANFNYEQDEQLIWSQAIAANFISIIYNGEPLQPGFIYDWEFVTSGKTYHSTFVMMTEEEKQAIAQDLAGLENRALADGKDKEEIAIAKADYLAQKQLWSDVLQYLYSVENPSADLVSKTEDIEEYLCESGGGSF